MHPTTSDPSTYASTLADSHGSSGIPPSPQPSAKATIERRITRFMSGLFRCGDLLLHRLVAGGHEALDVPHAPLEVLGRIHLHVVRLEGRPDLRGDAINLRVDPLDGHPAHHLVQLGEELLAHGGLEQA